MERYVGYLRIVLAGMVANDQQTVARLPLMSEGERRQVLEEWNQTEAAYPADRCIHELFETQVEQTPEAVAVVFEGEALTYRELDERANQLAHYLRREYGVGPEVRVALCLERSLEMVVAILGVLKAGGAYVPLDPGYPVERLRFMLEDSGASLLLTTGAVSAGTRHDLIGATPGLLNADLDQSEFIQRVANESRGVPSPMAGAAHLAYVLYTSGSTGRPKGVATPHAGVVNYLLWATALFPVAAGTRTLVHASISFDGTATPLFAPLIAGGAIHLFRRGLGQEWLDQTLGVEDFDFLKVTPSRSADTAHPPPAGPASTLCALVEHWWRNFCVRALPSGMQPRQVQRW